ncbi:MAG: hypothetical protein ABGY75_22050, partial [Gemmataceae bacterium]
LNIKQFYASKTHEFSHLTSEWHAMAARQQVAMQRHAPTAFDDDAVDRLTGGDGADWFVFHGTGAFADQVVDMSEFEGLFDLDQ